MTNKVLLNNVDHHDLTVIGRHAAEYGDGVNQVAVFPTEFEAVQRDYPILFARGDAGDCQAVALLGLDRDENLFLGEEGWTGGYVPALLRRGPFSIGRSAGQEPMIHVDLDDPRVARGGGGEPVFLPQGGNAPLLERASAALQTIYAGVEAEAAMYPALDALGLIQPVAVEVALSETETYQLPGFHAIDTARLAALGDADLGRLHRSGFLHGIHMLLASLGNIERLAALKAARRG
jgi:hypothetical protein